MIDPSNYKRTINKQLYIGVLDCKKESTAKGYAERIRKDGYNATFVPVKNGYVILKGKKKKRKVRS